MPSVVSVLPVFPAGRSRIDEPEGSGAAILDGRHILTAMHVVDGADRVMVRTSEGDIVDALVMGSDYFTDVAVLRLDTSLPPLSIRGDAELGEPVCALGNAFGLGLTVACGIVSGVHKAGIGFNRIEDFVQTDAAVNPGVSGGALIDDEGNLVGLVSAIFTKTSDANIGVNFAVAAPLVERVVGEILETGTFEPPPTGLELGPWPPFGEEGRQSAEILEIDPRSPVALAGLRVGDRIVMAADRRIRRPDDYVSAVVRLDPSEPFEVEFERAGKSVTVTVAPPAGAAANQ